MALNLAVDKQSKAPKHFLLSEMGGDLNPVPAEILYLFLLDNFNYRLSARLAPSLAGTLHYIKE